MTGKPLIELLDELSQELGGKFGGFDFDHTTEEFKLFYISRGYKLTIKVQVPSNYNLCNPVHATSILLRLQREMKDTVERDQRFKKYFGGIFGIPEKKVQ